MNSKRGKFGWWHEFTGKAKEIWAALLASPVSYAACCVGVPGGKSLAQKYDIVCCG